MTELRVIPVEGIPEVREGDDLATLHAAAASFEDGDVLVGTPVLLVVDVVVVVVGG